MHVLIVDGEEPLRKLLHRWVEAEGASAQRSSTTSDGSRCPIRS
jgi:hypothetical protein